VPLEFARTFGLAKIPVSGPNRTGSRVGRSMEKGKVGPSEAPFRALHPRADTIFFRVGRFLTKFRLRTIPSPPRNRPGRAKKNPSIITP